MTAFGDRSRSALRLLAAALLPLSGACGPEPSNGAASPGAVAGEGVSLDATLASGGGWQPVADTGALELSRLGYSRGDDGAAVAVYEFSDFGCSYCAGFARGTYPLLHREYVETGRVRWTFIPLVMGFPGGGEAARAAECAGEQEGFWAMHDALFSRQSQWQYDRGREGLFVGYAREIGLDAERFASCYREERGGARSRRNNRVALLLGLRVSPSFRVNGRLVEGALGAESFRGLLEAASRPE